jgi:hypothetical protein
MDVIYGNKQEMQTCFGIEWLLYMHYKNVNLFLAKY